MSGPTDIIDRVTSGGTAKEMSNTFKGELSSVNDPNLIQFTFDYDSRVTATEDAFLGSVAHYKTPRGDRYAKKSPCDARMTYFRYRPDADTGTSPFINFLDAPPGHAGAGHERLACGALALGERPVRSLEPIEASCVR